MCIVLSVFHLEYEGFCWLTLVLNIAVAFCDTQGEGLTANVLALESEKLKLLGGGGEGDDSSSE